MHDDLVQGKNHNFQLLKIKGHINIPKKVTYLFSSHGKIYFYGLVLNAHVNNMQGEDMYVVALFRSKSKSVDELSFKLDYSELCLRRLWLIGFIGQRDYFTMLVILTI